MSQKVRGRLTPPSRRPLRKRQSHWLFLRRDLDQNRCSPGFRFFRAATFPSRSTCN